MAGFLQQRPALKAGLAIAGGIVIGEKLSFSLDLISVVFLGFLILSILLFLLSKSSPAREILRSVFLLIALVLLGSWKFTLDKTSVTENLLTGFADSGGEVQLRGMILDVPRRRTKTDQIVTRAHHLSTDQIIQAAEGDLLVYVSREKGDENAIASVSVGSEIAVTGIIARPRAPRNPGVFDFRPYLVLHGISAVMYVESWSDVSLISTQTNGWSLRATIASIRAWIASVFDSKVGGVEAAFLKGILLGDRSEIPAEVKTSFINSGVVHVLAVSGFNVGMVALIFLSIFPLFRLGRVSTILLTIVFLFFYMLLTGSVPSVVRATIMATVILLAPLVQRKADVFNSLAFAAIVIFIIDTKQFFNPGFQLSFAAVASILYFYPKITRLAHHLPEGLRGSKAFDFVFKLFSVSVAAQIGTMPFTVAYFGMVSLISFVANLFVIPAVGIGLAVGFAIAFFSLLSAWITGIYGLAEQFLLSVILKVIAFSGNLSFAYIVLPKPDLLAFFIFYSLALLIFNFKEKLLGKKLIFALLILGNIAVLRSAFLDGPQMQVTVLDVGQGDATLIQFPSGKNLLVDAGPKSPSYDAGERIVLPFLKRTVNKLDAIVITHPHSDHLGGVVSILRAVPVGKVFDAGHKSDSRLYRDFLETIDELAIPYIQVRAGSTIALTPEARIFVLHPTKDFVQRDSLHYVRDLNNGSVVLKILYGKVGILMMGDAENPSEAQMLSLFGGFLKSNLIKVGHHGSKTSSGEEFIEMVQPPLAAISVGAHNMFGHPSTVVVSRYESHGTRVLRTDEEGALVFETTGRIISRVHWR